MFPSKGKTLTIPINYILKNENYLKIHRSKNKHESKLLAALSHALSASIVPPLCLYTLTAFSIVISTTYCAIHHLMQTGTT